MMINVDPGLVNDPNKAASPAAPTAAEYTVRAQQIVIQGMKVSGSGLATNTGNIYICAPGVGAGTGNRSDTGCIVLVIPANQTGVIASAPLNRNVFDPYRLFVDADNAGDSAIITLIIQ